MNTASLQQHMGGSPGNESRLPSLYLLALSLWCAAPALGAAPDCVPVPVPALHPQQVRGSVSAPGNYCLTRDITAVRRFDIHAGSFKSFGSEGLIGIRCPTWGACTEPGINDSFTIDLQGHRLLAKPGEMVGIENRSGRLRVSISNGHIEVPGRSASNVGIELSSYPTGFTFEGKGCNLTSPRCEDVPAARADGARAPAYVVTGYVIDKVSIQAGWRGVQMGGGGNMLRNSVIEVDNRVAAYQYGPGAVIENNTFIVHGKGEQNAFDAVLKLRDAHGAIVRNNTFIFRGGLFGKAPAAINLLDSTDVVITGNTFKGFEQTVRVNGVSSYSDKTQ